MFGWLRVRWRVGGSIEDKGAAAEEWKGKGQADATGMLDGRARQPDPEAVIKERE